MIEYEVKLNKHDLIVIDNLMSILSASAIEKMEKQAEFMQRCVNLSKAYRVHIILVLHPNKTYQKGADMDIEQISGNMDLGNKADNIISVIRYDDEIKKTQGINGKIMLIKNRYYPDLVSCNTYFDKETGQLAEIRGSDYILYKFNWKQYLPGYEQEHITGFSEVEGTDEPCPF